MNFAIDFMMRPETARHSANPPRRARRHARYLSQAPETMVSSQRFCPF
jgi:hypothetical protein